MLYLRGGGVGRLNNMRLMLSNSSTDQNPKLLIKRSCKSMYTTHQKVNRKWPTLGPYTVVDIKQSITNENT